MSKLFLILAILASGAASYVAWENKQTYGEVTDANKSLDKELLGLKEENRSEMAAIDDAKADLAREQDTRDTAEARFNVYSDNLATRTRKIAATRMELNGINGEIQEVVRILDDIDLPSAGDLTTALEDESGKKSEMEAQIDEKSIHADSLRKQVNDKKGVLAALSKSLVEDAASFGVKIKRASISAVDPTWGFAVINTNTAGINVNDRVIVERGGQRVGMLVVKTVEGSKVVANIVPETNTGSTVQPGDSVIFDQGKKQGS
ncbi:MAG: hypothetical protein ACI8T1_004091 [Verrucomicrobiales bacterium]|jgi:hypothetical protein